MCLVSEMRMVAKVLGFIPRHRLRFTTVSLGISSTEMILMYLLIINQINGIIFAEHIRVVGLHSKL